MEELERSPLNQNMSEMIIGKALKLAKRGLATGLDGCPYELWRKLDAGRYDADQRNLKAMKASSLQYLLPFFPSESSPASGLRSQSPLVIFRKYLSYSFPLSWTCSSGLGRAALPFHYIYYLRYRIQCTILYESWSERGKGTDNERISASTSCKP